MSINEPHDSYLLRVWPGAGSSWRATLTRVRDGATRTFTEPVALIDFLSDRALAGWPPASGESPTEN